MTYLDLIIWAIEGLEGSIGMNRGNPDYPMDEREHELKMLKHYRRYIIATNKDKVLWN